MHIEPIMEKDFEELGAEINKTEMNCDLSFNRGNN